MTDTPPDIPDSMLPDSEVRIGKPSTQDAGDGRDRSMRLSSERVFCSYCGEPAVSSTRVDQQKRFKHRDGRTCGGINE